MLERSAVTVCAVLVGFAPGVTVTVKSDVSVGATELGLAAPTPVGLVGWTTPCGVSEKLSTARPSSAPEASRSVQRIQKVAPLAMLKPVTVELTATRLAAALPSSSPTVPAETGPVKLSAVTAVQVPVVRLVAFVLY